MHTTPVLINTKQGTFDEYIASLTKPARKNYKYVCKHNSDLQWVEIDFAQNVELVICFMNLWEDQKIRGDQKSVV